MMLCTSLVKMTPRFDIFKIESGIPRWLDCVGTLQDCRQRLIELQPEHPEMEVWDSVLNIKYSATEFLAESNGKASRTEQAAQRFA